jgi:hypothetical protein
MHRRLRIPYTTRTGLRILPWWARRKNKGVHGPRGAWIAAAMASRRCFTHLDLPVLEETSREPRNGDDWRVRLNIPTAMLAEDECVNGGSAAPMMSCEAESC